MQKINNEENNEARQKYVFLKKSDLIKIVVLQLIWHYPANIHMYFVHLLVTCTCLYG